MDICEKQILKIADQMLNLVCSKSSDFYLDVLELFNRAFCADYLGVYFLDSNSLELKAQKKINLNFELDFLDEIFSCVNTSKEKTAVVKKTDKNIIFSKLMIRQSVFGVLIGVFDEDVNDTTKQAFETLTGICSYLIKENELSEVFKMQLKAMQEAVIEKDNAYKVIEKQHKKLIELDKTKNAFLANISHELRTPLNAIIGFSQALGAKIFGDLNDKQSEYINDIQVSSLHLLGMINEILDISKIESHAMKLSLSELSPAQLVQESINILMPLWKNKSQNVILVDNCESMIMADYQKFQQIIYNLLSNAIKFTKENGKIELILSKNGKDFIMEVKDNGIGIEKKNHKKVFSKFVHLDNIYTKGQSSTGLGLTITKELVTLHKGKITLESELNVGTTFKVILFGAVI